MGKKSIIISTLCLMLALPSSILASTNNTQNLVDSTAVVSSQVSTAALDSSVTPLYSEDTTGPVLENVTVSPSSVKVGETITITAQIRDDESGIESVNVNVNTPYGYKSIPLTFNATSGKWVAAYTIKSVDHDGDWWFSLNMWDMAGNYTYENVENPVQVVNPNADSDAPVLLGASVSKQEVYVDEEFTIKAKVSDNNEVAEVNAMIIAPEGFGTYIPLSLNKTTNEWEGTYSFSSYETQGTWMIDFDMVDTAGNYSWEEGSTSIKFTNPYGDSTEPTIDSVEISPKTASPGDVIQVNATVSDDTAGVDSVYAEFKAEGSEHSYSTLLNLDEETGNWVGEIYVQNNFMPGVWHGTITATDYAGNHGNKEIDNAFTIINENGDVEGPIFENIQVTQGDIKVGEKVTVSASITDVKSGVDMVQANLSGPYGYDYWLQLRYDSKTNLWVGSFLVEETTAPGIYDLTIQAQDKAGNYSYVSKGQVFTIINPTGDYTAPTMTDFQISKTEVNAGERVTFTAAITDDKSGVAYVKLNTDYLENVEFKYNSTLGKWTATVTIPTNIPDGMVINLHDIQYVDLKGNTSGTWVEDNITVHNLNGDYTAPQVESLSITPAVAKVGEKVQFKAKVKDDKSGTKSVRVLLETYEEYKEIDLTYDQASGLWTGNYTIKSYDKPGNVYAVVSTEDNNGNTDDFYTEKYFTVENPNGDINPPVFENVQVTPATANVGDIVKISATVSDDKSGVQDVYGYIDYSDYYKTEYVEFVYNATTKKWEGSYVVKEYDASGTWPLMLIAYDKFMNEAYIMGENTVVINNPGGEDVTNPYLESLTLTPSTAKDGDTVHFEAKLIDDKSGVRSARLYLNSDRGQYSNPLELTYDETKGVWVGDYKIPAFSAAGLHYVSVDFEDNAGNTQYEHMAKNLLILNESPDYEAPKFESITLTPEKVQPGKVVTFKVKLSDNNSGVQEASLTLFNPDTADSYNSNDERAYRYIPLTFDKTQNLWIGTYTVQTTDPLGSWKISYDIMDFAGNGNGGVSSQRLLVEKVSYSQINVQLNGKAFTPGFFGSGTTYVHWKVLEEFKIPFTFKGNGVFLIEGRTVQAETINGALYLNWKELSPGKVTYKSITGGFNFIYSVAKPVKVQLNGQDFTQGYFKDGNTYVHWQALNTFKIPYTFKGNNVFTIEGRTVTGETINGGLYIRWNELSPGNVTYKSITGGYNFIYTPPAPAVKPVKVQLNGQDFTQGYFKDGNTYVHWQALNTFKIPYTFKGNNVFTIEGRTVTGVTINGGLYIAWNQLSPGNVTYKAITGGYNFIYTAPAASTVTPIKVQLNGVNFTQGYMKDGAAYVHWKALETFKIPFTFKGNDVFTIEGRTVTGQTINGGLYIRWNELSPGKVTFKSITGGFNFIYTP